MQFQGILQTKITPPPQSTRTFARPRVTQVLLEALEYNLTILQAGAGYGKSTALAILSETYQPLIWYQITEGDNDPFVFLLHLFYATQRSLEEIEDIPIPFLERWEGRRGPLPAKSVLDMYINALNSGLREPSLLVFDDVQILTSPEIELLMDRLISLAPPNLHILISARAPIHFPNLSRWQAQGSVRTLDQKVLAFTPVEIQELFANHYGFELTNEEIEALSTATEGWAIALQLIWQSLRSGSTSIEAALTRQVKSLDGLFDILAKEVFERQPQDVRDFMQITATLHEMNPSSCDALIGAAHDDEQRSTQSSLPSTAMLAYLQRHELFVVNQGFAMVEPESNPIEPSQQKYHLRYHHIFHQFLRQQTPFEQRRRWHSHAATYFLESQNLDEAIYHFLNAEEPERAADLMDSYGTRLIESGRLDTLASYLDALPPEVLSNHPQLLYYLGDLARLHSRFEEALGWYGQAEGIWRERNQLEGVGKALRGQARVFLDTVDPSQAEAILQTALRLSDGTEDRESQARLYELLSENKLNAGKAEEAEGLRREAQNLRNEGPSDSQLLYRVLLRTGRLDEARRRLTERAELERREPVNTPRAHRETLHLLSLIYAFQGLSEEAHQAAIEGTRRGLDLDSPFVTAVGYMRQGHALMLPPRDRHPPDVMNEVSSNRIIEARQQFEKAIELSQSISVSRLRVEAYWGLCRSYGYQGDLTQATRYAQEGIELARQAGDEWIASIIRMTIGASLILAERYEAADKWLSQAANGFQECSDPFGASASGLWQCLGWFQKGDLTHLEQNLPKLLSTCQIKSYDFLFLRPTLLGLPDERLAIPLLIFARQNSWEPAYAEEILKKVGLANIEIHPGYRLYVSTMGTFQAWRGNQAIPPNGWRREKARQLFQILITFKKAPLDREQIIEYLWPDQEPSTANRNFKVALNTLYNVLEPEREAGSDSAFIVREGSTYGLRPGSDIWLDVDAFIEFIQEGDRLVEKDPVSAIPKYLNALNIYQGEYLPDARYETWAAVEREYLAVTYLRTADRLSSFYLQKKQYTQTIEICQRILGLDNCWERAYRHMMLAFHQLGDQGQVARTYQRCMQCLQGELEVKPAKETQALYQELTGKVEGE